MEKIQAGFKCQDQGKYGVLWEWWRRLGHSDKNKGAEEVTWNERAHIGFKKQYRVVPCTHPPDSSKCGILQNHHALSNPGNWYWHNTITSLQTWLQIHQFLHALILPVKHQCILSLKILVEQFAEHVGRREVQNSSKSCLLSPIRLIVSFCVQGAEVTSLQRAAETGDRQIESNQSQPPSGWYASQEMSQLLSIANGIQLYWFHNMSLVSADIEVLFECWRKS